MMRNVYLQGELGERFGSKFRMQADNTQEIIKCINANRPEFKNYLIECDKNDIGFTVEYQNKNIEDKNLLVPLEEGDVTIAILPAGSKSGIGKILAAVFIAFVVLPMIGAASFVGPGMTTMEGITAAMATTAGQVTASLAINLALTGIGQMMAPDPSVDKEAPDNYSFNGAAQNVKPGDPIPILYGELRVPGRPISINVSNQNTSTVYSTIIDGNNNMTNASLAANATQQHRGK